MPSLIEAIREKYCEDDTRTSNNGMILQFVSFKRNETNFVKKSQIPSLLVLNNFNVDHIGDDEEVQQICKDIQELDLASNQLSKWDQVLRLFESTPKLQCLNLSFNDLSEPFSEPSDFPSHDLPALSNLSTLILIGTHIGWDSVWMLLQKLVQLKELHLAKNNFISVDVPTQPNQVHHEDLKKLVFNENPIENWSEIKKIGQYFPRLEHLGLAETMISCIDESSDDKNFPNLKSLSLANTKIQDSHCVYNLKNFPALKELRIQGAMLFNDKSDHERRQMLIALVPHISKLNGTCITEEERESSERAFIRYFDSLHLEGNKPERYNELVEKHGKLQPLVTLDLSRRTHVIMRFVLGDKKITKKVSTLRSVKHLKEFCGKHFEVDPKQIRLFYVNMAINEAYGREEMKFPLKCLYSFNPEDGDEIHVVLRTRT